MEADPPGVAQLPEPVQLAQQVPVQVLNAQQQQTVPADPQAGNPAASVSEKVTAGTDANVASQSTSINIANLNFMKKVPQFQGKARGVVMHPVVGQNGEQSLC